MDDDNRVEGRARLHLLGMALTAVSCAWTLLGDLSSRVPAFLALLLLALTALLYFERDLWLRPRAPASRLRAGLLSHDVAVVFTVLAWAALMRLPLVASPPGLSDDIYRYIWESEVVAAGLDPYDLPPDDPSLAMRAQSSEVWEHINHRHLPAIYPPAAQGLFVLFRGFSTSVDGFRLAMIAVDLALITLLALLLTVTGRDARAVVLYAWHPLAVVETASSGHYEPFALIPLVAALLLLRRGHRWSAWVWWGVAFSAKYLGGVAAWFGALQAARERRWWHLVGGLSVTAITVAVLFGPFVLRGDPGLGSLGTYARHWGHNASVHALLTPLLGYHPARVAVAALFVLWLLGVSWKVHEPARALLLTFTGVIVLSPVVHPWYGLWVLVWMPLLPSLPLLLLTGLLPLSYLAWTAQAAGGDWVAPAWVPWVEYGVPPAVAVGLRVWRQASGDAADGANSTPPSTATG